MRDLLHSIEIHRCGRRVPSIVEVEGTNIHSIELLVLHGVIGAITDQPRMPSLPPQMPRHRIVCDECGLPVIEGLALVEEAEQNDRGVVDRCNSKLRCHGQGLHQEGRIAEVLDGVLPSQNLLPHQQAALVAEVQKALVLRVVGAPDEVGPDGFEDLDVAQEILVCENWRIRQVMPVEPDQFDRASVEQNLAVARLDDAKTEAHDDAIQKRVASEHSHGQPSKWARLWARCPGQSSWYLDASKGDCRVGQVLPRTRRQTIRRCRLCLRVVGVEAPAVRQLRRPLSSKGGLYDDVHVSQRPRMHGERRNIQQLVRWQLMQLH
mmetsp:Transcript_66673/g.216997  ORF Transcript_66673/g.216997 Transcript_66673/m.216997 type:complete len:321 (+) Transcript_66673:734-1696(+)